MDGDKKTDEDECPDHRTVDWESSKGQFPEKAESLNEILAWITGWLGVANLV